MTRELSEGVACEVKYTNELREAGIGHLSALNETSKNKIIVLDVQLPISLLFNVLLHVPRSEWRDSNW